jgi:predicted alpha/beta-hydrolase family hydrolase
LGGHSYGGRQASILAAEQNQLVAGLLLLAYPLHPPRKPLELRTGHFPALSLPSLFVHGERDPFGSVSEVRSALKLIPGRNMLVEIPGSGHELLPRKAGDDVTARIVETFRAFFA